LKEILGLGEKRNWRRTFLVTDVTLFSLAQVEVTCYFPFKMYYVTEPTVWGEGVWGNIAAKDSSVVMYIDLAISMTRRASSLAPSHVIMRPTV
jgi:hypothetical protein